MNKGDVVVVRGIVKDIKTYHGVINKVCVVFNDNLNGQWISNLSQIKENKGFFNHSPIICDKNKIGCRRRDWTDEEKRLGKDSKMVGNDFKHIYPLNDIKEHDVTSYPKMDNLIFEKISKLNKKVWAGGCSCSPEIDFKNKLIIHNAFDMRELEEI